LGHQLFGENIVPEMTYTGSSGSLNLSQPTINLELVVNASLQWWRSTVISRTRTTSWRLTKVLSSTSSRRTMTGGGKESWTDTPDSFPATTSNRVS